jgi:hypothetical protein
MNMRRIAAVVALALLGGGELAAQTQGTFLTPQPDEGTTRVAARGANFLEIGVGARGLALGGAYTGLATGATAMYWNPAGIGSTEGLTVAYSYAPLYGDLDITHHFAAVALPLFGGGAGVSIIQLSSGDIPRTDENFPDGENPAFGSVFSYSGTAIGVHYGRRLTDRLQIGVAAKVIQEGMTDAKASWWGLDFGTMFNTGLYGLRLGAALQNIGNSAAMKGALTKYRVESTEVFPFDVPVTFAVEDYQLPMTFRFAVVSDLAGSADALFAPGSSVGAKLALDLNDGVDTDLQSMLGLEINIRDLAFLRAGKKWVNERNDEEFRSFSHGLSFGGGLHVPLFGRVLSFDYAYTSMGELQNIQVFSFELGDH